MIIKPAVKLEENDIFRPIKENGFTAMTSVWARVSEVETLPESGRNIRIWTKEHGALALPRYHRVEVQ